MTAKLQRLSATASPVDAPRAMTRKVGRRAATGTVLVKSNTGDQTSARLRDISAFGCNLACAADWLRMGRFITLRLGKDWAIQAIVRWTRDGVTGVEFLRPLSFSETDSIVALG